MEIEAQLRFTKRTSGSVLECPRSGKVTTAARTVLDDWFLDERALMRWADDGGRWVDESKTSIQKVRV